MINYKIKLRYNKIINLSLWIRLWMILILLTESLKDKHIPHI